MAYLVKSLQEFPEMMEVREIVVDETMMCLGGNMRTLALREAGAKECIAKIVKGWTDKQKSRFIISDNGSWGSWDMDALANGWDSLPLIEWGIDLPKAWMESESEENENQNDPESEKPQIIICPKCKHEFSVLKEKKS